MSKEFDVNKDKSYDPNSSEFYLSEKQIKDALANIENDSDETKAVKSLIKKIETIHRNKCQGDIKASEASSQIKELNKEFSDKFNKWPFQTKAFEKFYAQFGSKELSSEMFDNIGENNMKLNHTKQSVSVISEEEFINALQDMTNTENDIFAMIEDMNELEFSFECYRDILKCVKEEGGVSQSLEMLFGSNFSSSEEMTTVASLEEEGFFSKVIQWVKDFFAKIWAWFKSWFQTRDGMIKNLEELKAKADTLEYPVIVPNYLSAYLKMGLGSIILGVLTNVVVDIREVMQKVENTTPIANKRNTKVNMDGPAFKAMSNFADAVKNSEGNVFHPIIKRWETLKAKLSWDGIKFANGNEKLDRDGFISAINAVISGLKYSKEISDKYEEIEKSFKTFLESENASFIWLKCKTLIVYIWKENNKYFRSLLRLGNLLLQRAKEGSGKTAAPATEPAKSAEPQKPAETSKKEEKPIDLGVTQVPYNPVEEWAKGSFSTEFLQLENEFLRDELEFNQLTHEMELLETVIDCIKKEGGVSDSLQNMFGENWTSKESALEELEVALEGFIKDQFNKFVDDTKTKMVFKALTDKFEAVKKLILEKGDNITLPITVIVPPKMELGENCLRLLRESAQLCDGKKYKEAYALLKEAADTFNKDGWNEVREERIESLDKLQDIVASDEEFKKSLQELFEQCHKIQESFKKAGYNFFSEGNKEVNKDFKITPAHVERFIGFTKRLLIRTMMRAVGSVEKALRAGGAQRDKSNDLNFGK